MNLYAHLETTKGSVIIKLFRKEVPVAVNHFRSLVTGHPEYIHPVKGKTSDPFYENMKFHYIAKGAYIQTGCPYGDGTGYITPPEPYEKTSPFSHVPGSVSMARSGNTIEGGQFFICLNPMPHFDGIFTVFGKVDTGMEILESISHDDLIIKIWLEEH